MGRFVIFSSPWVCVLLAAALILHTLPVILRRLMGQASGRIVLITSIINAAVHTAIIVFMMALKASPEEMFFVLALSSAVALTASGTGKEAK